MIWQQWADPAGWFAGSLVAFLALRMFLLGSLRRRSAAGAHPYTGVFLDAIRVPAVFWCLAAALSVAARYADLNARQEKTVDTLIFVFLIVSASLVLANVLARMLAVFGARRGLPMAGAGLSQTLTYVVVLTVGALVLLRYFNIAITPILGLLGVGGLAVGLALQDTLSNLFAGVHLLIEEPFKVGDFIRLSTGEEGTVTDIGWRTTRLLMGTNNLIVIPNNKITTTNLINHALPAAWLMTEIDVVTRQDADVDLIRKLALEAAAESELVLKAPAPVFLVDPGMLPTHLQCKLIVPIADRLQQGLARSAVRERMIKKFAAHEVPMPVGERLIGWP